MPRDHHLRARRLRLGASQELIGCLADWPVRSAQSMVSSIERGLSKNLRDIRRVRSAIVYLELEPRRRREWERAEAKAADVVEAAILLNRAEVIEERLIDLLIDGRCDDFDTLALRVSDDIVARAGEAYLDQITPSKRSPNESQN